MAMVVHSFARSFVCAVSLGFATLQPVVMLYIIGICCGRGGDPNSTSLNCYCFRKSITSRMPSTILLLLCCLCLEITFVRLFTCLFAVVVVAETQT